MRCLIRMVAGPLDGQGLPVSTPLPTHLEVPVLSADAPSLLEALLDPEVPATFGRYVYLLTFVPCGCGCGEQEPIYVLLHNTELEP
jgi:hypothetical protein